MKPKRTRSKNAEWNARNPEVIKAAMKRLEARNLAVVAEELASRGGRCVYPGCAETKIEWHHRDPATKTKSIGSSVRLHSVARLRTELALCDPLCRRHHMVVDGRTERAKKARIGMRSTSRKADSKLTENEVRAIRRRVADGETQSSVAREYGVAQSAVSFIVSRRNWAWLSS